MRKLRALVAITAMLAVFVAGQTPASAHTTTVHHGKDSAGVSADHTYGWVCDNERDGPWVAVGFNSPYHDGGWMWEYDGGDAGCDYISIYPQFFDAIVICEENKGCNWDYHYS